MTGACSPCERGLKPTRTAGSGFVDRPELYPIPDDGPVGRMLRAQGRHPYRPAHVHFMISPGCETLVTHVFIAGDHYLDSDVVFGVKDALVRALERQPAGVTAHGHTVARAMAALRYDFTLAPAR